MMPKLDGLQVCEFIRQNDDTVDLPVIMLTARGEEADKVMGLSIGADDYITKPFSVAELIARIKAVLRRIKPIDEKGTLSFADILIDLEIHKVSRNNRIIHLGPTEFRLLKFLMENSHTVFSRED
jgi:two-component system phosphate regulon response regulator PhoB